MAFARPSRIRGDAPPRGRDIAGPAYATSHWPSPGLVAEGQTAERTAAFLQTATKPPTTGNRWAKRTR